VCILFVGILSRRSVSFAAVICNRQLRQTYRAALTKPDNLDAMSDYSR